MYRTVDALHGAEGAQTRKDDTYISDRLMMLEGSYHSKVYEGERQTFCFFFKEKVSPTDFHILVLCMDLLNRCLRFEVGHF